MSGLAAFALICAATTAVLAVAYIAIWRRSRPAGRTPTGFGILFAPALLAAALTADASAELVLSLWITTGAALVYWLDDLVQLSARLRVIFSFAVGVALGAAYFWGPDFTPPLGIALMLLAGLVNLALVNTINFQDGADLNLALFILLTGALLALYAPGDPEWTPIAIACLAFTLPFAALNSRPDTIYFGDSGSFVFACLLTILGAAFLAGRTMPPPEASIPAALPVVDMIFVTALRIRIRQRFTVRHYFHLYQRLQKDQWGFFYLVPQVVNVALALGAATLLEAAGLGRTVSVALGTAVVTVPLFLLFRRVFVTGEPGPPVRRGIAA